MNEIKKLASRLLEDLRKEQNRLTEDFPICCLLIEEAFDRFYSTGLLPGYENYADVLNQKPIRLTQKVLVHSTLFAAKRHLLTRLENETKCEILIKGRNSVNDNEKEMKLRNSGEPQFNHLYEYKDMYLEISIFSTPIDCYSRIAYALAEIRKYLIFDRNDVLHDDLHEVEIGTEIVGYSDHVKREQLNQANVIQDPLLVDSVMEEHLPSSLGKQQVSENKPNFIGVAKKSMKLFDESGLNPDFRYSEDENITSSNNLDKLNINYASKLTSDPTKGCLNEYIKDIPIDETSPTLCKYTKQIRHPTKSCLNEYIKDIPIDETSPTLCKYTKQIRSQNRGLNKIRAMKQTKLQKFTNSNLFKSKSKTEKRRQTENILKYKKGNYPGIFYLKDKNSNKIIKHRILIKSALYRCLRRCKNESIEPEENEHFKPSSIEFLQESPSELVFEYTPREIVISLLENMKNYPVLWEFHDKPFNEDYDKATKDLCETINLKWSLNIDILKMRRSVTRVLRFYRYLFPFECIDKFVDYFNKCAGFLPSGVIKIPHARCSHCFICYKEDFELKKHLLEEHKSLMWRYNCQYCMESFRDIREYEFHKLLPHYVEVFTCEQCYKRFHNKFSYSRHLDSHNKNTDDRPRNFICDECGKDFKTNGELRGHKAYHGEKTMKCHLCPKSYFKNTSLMLHLKTHRKELDFICEVCGHGFICEPNLKNHMETHMKIQVTCTICGLKLRKHNLSRHLRTIHVACEGTIEDTYRAKGHNHKRYTQIYSSNRSQRAKRSKEKHERQYDCKTCNIPFDRLKYLKDHNKKCHSNVNKIPCKICGSQLSHKQNLKRHYREKHKLDDDQIVEIMQKNDT